MIPYNDVEANRYMGFPFMTFAIIAVNVIILGLQHLVAGDGLLQYRQFIYTYGTTPALVLNQQGGGSISALSSMFLHGGFLHIFGNMLGLWVYGRRVEDACGSWRFLQFYLASGLLAAILHTTAEYGSDIPAIGASGAVFGVMGAYLILYPKGRIRTLVLLGIFPLRLTIRAIWLIPYFFLLEIPPALDIIFNQGANFSVGHWAHLGGFFGSLFVFFFLRPDAFYRYRNELPL